MIELLLGVDFELGGNVHVLGAAEHLGIDDVGDDGLILAGQVFVQQLREPVAGNVVAFLARDTATAFAFLARLPDPDATGYRAAAYADLALMAQHHSDPTYWTIERAAMRHARLEAARMRSPELKTRVLRTILSHLAFYAWSDDTRRTPGLRAFQDSVVWDVDSTAQLLPLPARTREWPGVAGTWAHRHHVREALAVLARLPTRAARDSAAARIFPLVANDTVGLAALSDSLGLPSDTLPATTRAMRAMRAAILLNHGDTVAARVLWRAVLFSMPPGERGDTVTLTQALFTAVRGHDVGAAEAWAERAREPRTRAAALRRVADAVRSNGTGYPAYLGGGRCGEW
jgi:hypothetical protein